MALQRRVVSEGRANGASGRMPGLDGIRTVAVTIVLLVHASLLSGGFIGVDLFFVLSGFLITTLMLGEVDRTGRLDIVAFWIRRGFRLLPALVVFLLAGILMAALTRHDVLRPTIESSVAIVCGFYNYVWLSIGGGEAWVSHLWSLCVEAQFYLLWPLAFVVGMRARRRSRLFLSGAVVILAIGAWRAALGFGLVPGITDWYHRSETRVDAFLVGAMLALALHVGVLHAATPRARGLWHVAPYAGWAVIAVACVFSRPLNEDPAWPYVGGLFVVALACAAIVGSTILLPDSLPSRILRSRPMDEIGKVSYPFYLWHFPVIFGLEPHLDPHLGRIGTTVVAFLVTLLLAEASTRLVERPVARFRRRIEGLRLVDALRHVPALDPAVPPAEPVRHLPAGGALA